VGKLAEMAVCRSVFLKIRHFILSLYFKCRINKKNTPSDCFFGGFAHWEKSNKKVNKKKYIITKFRIKELTRSTV